MNLMRVELYEKAEDTIGETRYIDLDKCLMEATRVDETDTYEVVRDDMGGYGKRMTVHVMECERCGRTYEHVNGDYEFCPWCTRRIEVGN